MCVCVCVCVCITVSKIRKIWLCHREHSGLGCVVGRATGYGLDGPGIESRCSKIFHTCPERSWGPPSLLYNGCRGFSRE